MKKQIGRLSTGVREAERQVVAGTRTGQTRREKKGSREGGGRLNGRGQGLEKQLTSAQRAQKEDLGREIITAT